MGQGCRGRGSDDAVAEIIGTILLVAVAVILAAAISSFGVGMAIGVTRTVAIAVSAEQSGDDIVLTYMGGKDNPLSRASMSPAPRRTAPQSTTPSTPRRRPSARR